MAKKASFQVKPKLLISKKQPVTILYEEKIVLFSLILPD